MFMVNDINGNFEKISLTIWKNDPYYILKLLPKLEYFPVETIVSTELYIYMLKE